ncbi:hypothetical protein BESB_012030 [Besnoitia besnoiti]|uniref:CRAL-TRIO domain-containing protein n=1 Tax=Besnoitia besnoiti TaxID=94643 RepID=A0A2A9M8G0_BESBE|nr:hypothetical protein BESB_012030 [Besnoitia besnoiti]PFH32591.1 hypothetical protein BESB_012030 [Besnoitia besnoiti]
MPPPWALRLFVIWCAAARLWCTSQHMPLSTLCIEGGLAAPGHTFGATSDPLDSTKAASSLPLASTPVRGDAVFRGKAPSRGEREESTRELWRRAFGPRSTPATRRRLLYTLPPPPDPTRVDPKILEAARNPPPLADQLAQELPFSFYLPDKDGYFLVFIQAGKMNIERLQAISPEQIVAFIKFVGCLFFGTIEGRPEARVRIVFDCDGVDTLQLLRKGGLSTMRATLQGVSNLALLLGDRTADFVIVNVSMALSTLIELAKQTAHPRVRVTALGGPSEYVPWLTDLVGAESLPASYGGTATTPIGETPVAVVVRRKISDILRARAVKRANKAEARKRRS